MILITVCQRSSLCQSLLLSVRGTKVMKISDALTCIHYGSSVLSLNSGGPLLVLFRHCTVQLLSDAGDYLLRRIDHHNVVEWYGKKAENVR
jgi:hypothetical protein